MDEAKGDKQIICFRIMTSSITFEPEGGKVFPILLSGALHLSIISCSCKIGAYDFVEPVDQRDIFSIQDLGKNGLAPH